MTAEQEKFIADQCAAGVNPLVAIFNMLQVFDPQPGGSKFVVESVSHGDSNELPGSV